MLGMRDQCPFCLISEKTSSVGRSVVRIGTFRRKSDSQIIQRFNCKRCFRGFSRATTHPCVNQNKRHKNEIIRKLLCSGVSQRRIARVLHLNRKTVVRKMIFLSVRAQIKLHYLNSKANRAKEVEFDDLETFEHTKCKPLSVTLAVEYKSRRILGFAVSQMPAKGMLSAISLKKYGYRKDHRSEGRKVVFSQIKKYITTNALIRSDSNPHYTKDIKKLFPKCRHETVLGGRGATTGQGELKKLRFDPLFSLNHTCAKLRADINRLFRRTWCTTKRPDRLAAHLAIYAAYHNENLKIS